MSRLNMTFWYSYGCPHLHGRHEKNGRPLLCRGSRSKKSPLLMSKRHKGLASSGTMQKRGRMKEMNGCMKQLKAEMEEISKEQQSIRQCQKEVRKKFEAIESECQQLRNDTRLMAQQGVITKRRLGLMFQILKARNNNDFATATELTRILREMMTRNTQT